jgi:hypothetical protein
MSAMIAAYFFGRLKPYTVHRYQNSSFFLKVKLLAGVLA